MKGKVRTRLLSALLTLAMLVSLMPAAFALSYDEKITDYVDLDDEISLSSTDFDMTDLYTDTYFIKIYALDGDAPTIEDKYGDDVEGDFLAWNASVYFNADSWYTEEGSYDYDIDCYDRNEDWIGTVRLTLYVYDDGYYADGDIYAETDIYGYLDMSDISDEIYDYAYYDLWGFPYYVRFMTWDGTLYDGSSSSSQTSTADYYYFDEDDVVSRGDYYLDDAWFEADDLYEESVITFRVYDKYGYYVSGSIVINADGSSFAGDIKYSAEYNGEVYFDGADFEDLLTSSQTLSYVTFTLPSSTKGTLYWGSDKLVSGDKLYSDDLYDVSFVPKSGVTGNVSIPFRLYYTTRTSSSVRSFSGAVVVSIDSSPAISYSGRSGEDVAFDAGDFDDICYEVTGKHLNYVRFSLPSGTAGTLYAAGSTAAKSTDKFYAEPGKNDYGLDGVVFVPKTSGMVEVAYTAYNTAGVSYTGRVKIDVAAGTLSAINYTVKNGRATFSASDFADALKAKTSRTLSSVTFALPASTVGTLYYDGSTKVTAGTQYKAAGSADSLDLVSFVPAYNSLDDVTIAYIAKDSGGITYVGTVVIKTFVGQDTVLTYTTTGKAAVFQNSDFTDACLKKLASTLSYVQFTLPDAAQGTLYYGYGTTQQTPVSASAKYIAGTHLDYVSFLPKAGFSGDVAIRYTGYDTLGQSYTGAIQVTVTPPKESAYFPDASESWVAPAADFLYVNGVYTGVVNSATLDVGAAVTRGEMMQMIYNAFHLENKVSTVTSNFTDVPITHPYYTAINAGNALGIALGYDGKFRPGESITREDAITLLYRAFTTLELNLTDGDDDVLKSFGDYATVSDYAVSAMANMISSGIIQGNENNDISPKSNLNRGEISVILHRAMTL